MIYSVCPARAISKASNCDWMAWSEKPEHAVLNVDIKLKKSTAFSDTASEGEFLINWWKLYNPSILAVSFSKLVILTPTVVKKVAE